MEKGTDSLSKILDEERSKKYFFGDFSLRRNAKNPLFTGIFRVLRKFSFHVERKRRPELFHVKLMFLRHFHTHPSCFT